MFYTVYKTTDLTNAKTYIGKHKTHDIEDGYLGSGKLLRRAIEKHGRENFEKEILHVLETEEEMDLKEAELVTEEFCLRDDNYNLCVGGRGGWSLVNREGQNGTREGRSKGGSKSSKMITSAEHSARVKNARSMGCYDHLKGEAVAFFKGKKHSERTIEKIRLSRRGKSTGENNSQFGTMWITDGSVNRKIKKCSEIPQGWFKGRKT